MHLWYPHSKISLGLVQCACRLVSSHHISPLATTWYTRSIPCKMQGVRRIRPGNWWEGMHRATRLREGSGGPISTLVGIRLRTHLSDCWRWVLLAALLALLPGWTDAAGSQAQVLRAGSGLRANEVQAHHLTRKAVCSGTFLGQSPLFKGEWVAHEVCSPSYQQHPC